MNTPHSASGAGALRAYTVKVIDADGAFHRYTQLAATCAAAEALAFGRFGGVRLLSVSKARMSAYEQNRARIADILAQTPSIKSGDPAAALVACVCSPCARAV